MFNRITNTVILTCDCVLACSLCNIELAFLVDSSTKSNEDAWTLMRSFVSDVVRQYNISPFCVRAAVITYSSTATAPILLTSYSSVNSLVQAIDQLQFLGGSSNLATALNLLRSQVFADSAVRSNTARIAIIITDQLQSSSLITTAASSVRSQRITVVGVGIIGPGRVNFNYLRDLTSNRWAIQVSDYSRLISEARNTIVQQYGCLPYDPPPTTASPGILRCCWIKKRTLLL